MFRKTASSVCGTWFSKIFIYINTLEISLFNISVNWTYMNCLVQKVVGIFLYNPLNIIIKFCHTPTMFFTLRKSKLLDPLVIKSCKVLLHLSRILLALLSLSEVTFMVKISMQFWIQLLTEMELGLPQLICVMSFGNELKGLSQITER